MKMFFYTLSQSDDLPEAVLFMNGGVKLPTLNDQVARAPVRACRQRRGHPRLRDLPQLLRDRRQASGRDREQHVRHRRADEARRKGRLPLMDCCVIVFSSTHSAMRAEKHLTGRFPVTVMPTPRAVSASCGISLRFPPGDAAGVRAAMEELPGERGCWEIYRLAPDGKADPIVPT